MKKYESLIYGFKQYIKNVNSEKYSKIIFEEVEDELLKRAYDIAIGNIHCKQGNKSVIYSLKNIFKDKDSYIPLQELSFDEKLLVRTKDVTIDKELWNEYIDKTIEEVNKKKLDYESLYYLLMKRLSTLPAINKPNCNVSLFDVCKVTSAIYYCLKINEKELLLIKGDFSGIQNFIFRTKKEDALKTLKGRSFYLTLLQDLCSKYIVRELNLNISNVLYSGGGNFYILASKADIERLDKIKKDLSNIILKAHKGELYMSLAYVGFKVEDFEFFSEIWKSVGEESGKAKTRKWSEIGLKENFVDIFGPIDSGGTLDNTCSVCGSIYKNLDSENRCSLCTSYIQLVEDASNKKIYVEKNIKDHDIKTESYRNVKEIFKALGYEIFFLDKMENLNREIQTSYAINNFQYEEAEGYTFKSIRFIKKSLDDISKSQWNLGDNKIGVLKLDVDNLGSLFIQAKSIGQVMTLSRSLSMFFEGFVQEAIVNEYIPKAYKEGLKTKNWKEKITIIYAGGDDTFIVGRYDEVFEFAYILRKLFEVYTQDKGKTFSAGVGMFDSNFPILQTANITEGFLEKGKSSVGKDKICFMGEVFSWNEYFEIMKLKNKIESLYNLTENNALFEKIDKSTKGFKSVFKRDGKGINYLKIYRLSYYLRELNKGDAKEKVEDLINQYEELCLNSIKKSTPEVGAMIIPYANKWARCNCRKL
ncbi:type III-A CRISPR-associated protein Cas10/Csm1 [Clostridium sp. Marseille-QA1073]